MIKKVVCPDNSFFIDVYGDDGKYKRIRVNISAGKIQIDGQEYSYMSLLTDYRHNPDTFSKLSFSADSNLEIFDYLRTSDFISSRFVEEVLINKIMTEAEFVAKHKEILDNRKLARQYLKRGKNALHNGSPSK
jgi:hypothetical protein